MCRDVLIRKLSKKIEGDPTLYETFRRHHVSEATDSPDRVKRDTDGDLIDDDFDNIIVQEGNAPMRYVIPAKGIRHFFHGYNVEDAIKFLTHKPGRRQKTPAGV